MMCMRSKIFDMVIFTLVSYVNIKRVKSLSKKEMS